MKVSKRYLQHAQYSIHVFIMLNLALIVVSDLVVADLFMHSLSGMILLYLATPGFL